MMIAALVLLMAIAIAVLILFLVAAGAHRSQKLKRNEEKPKRQTLEMLLADDGELLEVVEDDQAILEEVQAQQNRVE